MEQLINMFQDFLANFGVAGFLAGLFMGFMFVSAFLIIFYLAMAIGLYRMAMRADEPNAWIAFIPFVQFYLIGQLLGRIRIGNTEITKPNLSYLFVAISLAPFFLAEMPVVGMLVVVFSVIAWFIGMYYLFQRYSRFEVIFTLINILTLGFASAFIVLGLSGNEQIVREHV